MNFSAQPLAGDKTFTSLLAGGCDEHPFSIDLHCGHDAANATAIAPQSARAQTPAQMEYERQQREYRPQQEQQRQQQLMNENARRQQEESRRLNAPMGQSPAPGYQGTTPQMVPQRVARQAAAPVVTAATNWVSTCSSPGNGGTDVYLARSTINRTGNLVKMWDIYDFKTTQVIGGVRVLSAKKPA